jgi:hypothetical protein
MVKAGRMGRGEILSGWKFDAGVDVGEGEFYLEGEEFCAGFQSY